ncbi:MAG: hypothetical protein HQM08_29800 [Candidatus Riflebacteria bacterium]|nr:hypothetical protein [Candidatus Riflebacteria bacterium]
MTTKQLVLRALDQLEETDLEKLYEIIKTLVKGKKSTKKTSLLKSLSQIKIEAPSDFAENHDAYLNGEKHAKTPVR